MFLFDVGFLRLACRRGFRAVAGAVIVHPQFQPVAAYHFLASLNEIARVFCQRIFRGDKNDDLVAGGMRKVLANFAALDSAEIFVDLALQHPKMLGFVHIESKMIADDEIHLAGSRVRRSKINYVGLFDRHEFLCRWLDNLGLQSREISPSWKPGFPIPCTQAVASAASASRIMQAQYSPAATFCRSILVLR